MRAKGSAPAKETAGLLHAIYVDAHRLLARRFSDVWETNVFNAAPD